LDPDQIEPLPLPFLTTGLVFSDHVLLWLAVILLLICSALISASEVAFFGLKPADKEQLAQGKGRVPVVISNLLENQKLLLATILIANNMVNILIIILSTMLAESIFSSVMWSKGVVFFVQIAATTFILLLFGEVMPKVFATRNRIWICKIMAVPLQVLSVIFKWPANVLIKSSNFIEKRLRKQDGRISLGELEHALEITTTEETSDEQEQRILEGIVKFGNTDAKQIMTPRMDVTAFHIELNFRQVLDGITESGFSRIPVYQDSFDQIKGVLYAKDFIRHLDEADDFNWQPLIRQAFFVPENRKIDDLLRDFQNRKMHMAIVVDEYGGSSGIVTLEDVLEEIIGDITDEFDEDEIRHKRIDDHNVIFDGKTSLIDVYRILDIDGDEFEANKGESDTLAGFLLELSGRIMHKNERISFGDYIFTVEGADRRRVKQIKVTIKETADSTAKND